jgi:hypothetical protein
MLRGMLTQSRAEKRSDRTVFNMLVSTESVRDSSNYYTCLWPNCAPFQFFNVENGRQSFLVSTAVIPTSRGARAARTRRPQDPGQYRAAPGGRAAAPEPEPTPSHGGTHTEHPRTRHPIRDLGPGAERLTCGSPRPGRKATKRPGETGCCHGAVSNVAAGAAACEGRAQPQAQAQAQPLVRGGCTPLWGAGLLAQTPECSCVSAHLCLPHTTVSRL